MIFWQACHGACLQPPCWDANKTNFGSCQSIIIPPSPCKWWWPSLSAQSKTVQPNFQTYWSMQSWWAGPTIAQAQAQFWQPPHTPFECPYSVKWLQKWTNLLIPMDDASTICILPQTQPSSRWQRQPLLPLVVAQADWAIGGCHQNCVSIHMVQSFPIGPYSTRWWGWLATSCSCSNWSNMHWL